MGVMLAAASAMAADASRLVSASSMLLFHAKRGIGAVALAARGSACENRHYSRFRLRHRAGLFAGDLTHGITPATAVSDGRAGRPGRC